MNNSSVSEYQKINTIGKSQIDLIIQVYDNGILNFNLAKDNFSKNKIENGHKNLDKARNILTHLYTTLDMEKGGDIATQLSKLYAFIINQINIVDATKDISQIDDIITIMENLREGWIGLKEQQAQQPLNESAEPAELKNKSFVTSG